jgi:hypothetical protein
LRPRSKVASAMAVLGSETGAMAANRDRVAPMDVRQLVDSQGDQIYAIAWWDSRYSPAVQVQRPYAISAVLIERLEC